MRHEDKVFKELFANTDSILIIDTNGKVLYYEDFNDQINMIRYDNAVGRSIYELYPFFRREDFTCFKAIDNKSVIVNELQSFEVNGVAKKALNSAYPLINETGVIGCLVMTVELKNNGRSTGKQKSLLQFSAKYNFEDIITRNKTFLASFDVLRRLASSDSSILINGETGTGKELIAHTIHNNSPRRRKPFIVQNCAAIPDNLMESTLFGSVKGSYTGAIDRAGLFEVADGGTLYFDEINSLSPDLQAKLLRVIEDKTIRRVGDTVERDVDVRIIASTNEDLSELVEENRFRKDLFYRLNVASYSIMPLRERADDIPLVCEHFIKIYNARLNHFVSGIDDEVMEFLLAQPWEGNVRELKNVIEYACTIRTEGPITMSDLPAYMFGSEDDAPAASSGGRAVVSAALAGDRAASSDAPAGDRAAVFSAAGFSAAAPAASAAGFSAVALVAPGKTLAEQLDALEKEIITRAVTSNRYNISKTAAELDISRQTLYSKLKKYGLA